MAIEQLQFLIDNFGLEDFARFSLNASLPLYFTKRYKRECLKTGGKELLFLTPQREFCLTEAKKDAHFCNEKLGIQAVFVLQEVTAYQKTEMMKNHIQFVIPPTQAYIPNIGVAVSLRNEPKRQQEENIDVFSVATQRVFLSLLYAHDGKKVFTASDLAREHDVSVMTASRIIREWVAAGVGTTKAIANKKVFSFASDGRLRFDSAREYLFSPVVREYRLRTDVDVDTLKRLHPAGLTVLSRWTMLNDDIYPTMAVTAHEYKLNEESLKLWKAPKEAEQYITLQIWKYSIATEEPYVSFYAGEMDGLSVVLSLCELARHDERVDIAIQEYLEKIKW